MHKLKSSTNVGYEDLMREIGSISQSLLAENSTVAMELMVLESKIRARFEEIENPDKTSTKPFLDDEMSPEEIQTLIPLDYEPLLGTPRRARPRKVQSAETMGLAAALAVVVALGILGIAALLQVSLNWFV